MRRLLSFLLVVLFLFSLPLSVQAKSGFSHGGRNSKKIALSFDDGPHPVFTPKILALLARYNVKATFFMIGVNVTQYPQIARSVYAAGHEIGNHTYTHPHMKEISTATLKEEILKTEEALCANGIPKPHLFRPPEGFRSSEQAKMIDEEGYQMVIWSLDTHDWQGKPPGEIVSVVLNGIQGGDVLLFHDFASKKNTITALERLIPELLKDGYEFVTVSELMC